MKPKILMRNYPLVQIIYDREPGGQRVIRSFIFHKPTQSAIGALRHLLHHIDLAASTDGEPPYMPNDR